MSARAGLPTGYFARAATHADIAATASLINVCERVDLGEPVLEAADLQAGWRAEGFDVSADVVLVMTEDGSLVGAASVEGRRAQGDVHPQHRGRGIGSWLLSWIEVRADEIGGRPGAPVGQTLGLQPDGGIDLLRARGYTLGWESWLLRYPVDEALPPAPPLDGVTLRQATRSDDRAVHAVIEAAFDWPGRSPRSFDGWHDVTVGHQRFAPELMWVAVDDADEGRIVGACVGLAYPEEGWIDQLAVDVASRGQGVGRALMTQVFAELRAMGAPQLGLSTDSRTGALGLYTRFGLQVALTLVHLDRPPPT